MTTKFIFKDVTSHPRADSLGLRFLYGKYSRESK